MGLCRAISSVLGAIITSSPRVATPLPNAALGVSGKVTGSFSRPLRVPDPANTDRAVLVPHDAPHRVEPGPEAVWSPAQRRWLFELARGPMATFEQLSLVERDQLSTAAIRAARRYTQAQAASWRARERAQAAQDARRARVAAMVAQARATVRGRAARRGWAAAISAAVAAGTVVTLQTATGPRDYRLTAVSARLAGGLLRWADFDDGGDIRPGWELLIERLDIGRSTLAHHLRLLQAAGFLATLAGGRHATRVEIAETGIQRLAAVYALRRPAEPATVGTVPGNPTGRTVDNSGSPASDDALTRPCHSTSWTPPVVGSSVVDHSSVPDARETGLTAGGGRSAAPRQAERTQTPVVASVSRAERRRDRTCRYTLDRLPHPRSPKYARYALAADLLRTVRWLRGARLSAVAHAVRAVAAAGWNTQDVIAHLDGQRPVPAEAATVTPAVSLDRDKGTPPAPHAVRHPARFLAHRLADAATLPRPTELREQAHAQATAALAAERTAWQAELAAAEANRVAGAHASSHADTWAQLRSRLGRRVR